MAKRLICFYLFCLLPTISFANTISRTRILMGDVPVIITVTPKHQQTELDVLTATEKSYQVAKKLISIFSNYQTDSEINHLNLKGLTPQTVSPPLWNALIVSEMIWRNSQGYYDPTYISKSNPKGMNQIIFNNTDHSIQFKHSGIKLDLTAIAKGMIIHEMTKRLKKSGFKNFIINAGGDLYVSGKQKIRIRYTKKNITVKNSAVTSAGRTERGDHLFNPKTDQASHQPFLSTTVIGPSAAIANCLSTALYVGGPDLKKELKKNFKDYRFFITKQKN